MKVMGGLERQVADYQEREDEVQRLARESKQQVEDALSLKDQVGLIDILPHTLTDQLTHCPALQRASLFTLLLVCAFYYDRPCYAAYLRFGFYHCN